MADPRSSSSTSQIKINLSATQIDYSSFAKTLNSNIPMKLSKTNYIYWKTQVIPAIRALDLDDYISSSSVVLEAYIEVHSHIEEEETLIQKQLQNIKKGSDSISDFVLKIKNIGDALMIAEEEVMEPCNVIGALISNFRDLILQILKDLCKEATTISKQQHTMPLMIQ
ncbi:hypothetical protein ACOSQ3_020708 [Xanthoceras sorbifolium]